MGPASEAGFLWTSPVSEHRCWQEYKERLKAQCKKVEQVGEEPHSYNIPGSIAFSKARPPQ